jgi:diguanylate cyclase (GGDEF)-like protein
MADTTSSLLQWRRQHANKLFAVYSVVLFGCAAILLGRAWMAGEFVLAGSGGLIVAACSYLLAIFIILLGFSTPRFAYVSLDRITQVGLIVALGPADAALINALASFTYPLIALRRQFGLGMALVRSLHNCAMFAFTIYWAGLAYKWSGGAVPLVELDLQALVAFAVLILCMQSLNSVFLHLRAVVMAVPRRLEPDWFSHAVEIPVAIVGILTALIYSGMSLAVFALFMLMLISVIIIAKFLNKVTIALKRRIKQVITVNRIAKAISSSVQLEHLIQVVYSEVRQSLDPSEFYFGVRNGHNGALEFQDGRVPGPGARKLMTYCTEHQLPLHIASLRDRGSSVHHLLDPAQRLGGSLICVPIIYNHEVLGVIYVASETEQLINHDHYKLMQAISRQVSTAIKNIKLISHLEERKETLEQKVSERVAEIEQQKLALEQANLRQEELLDSLRAASAELERQNREDALTGLYNRRHMDEFLARECERADRRNSPMTVAMIDVDHFKLVNDKFSHQVGDATLKALGVILPHAVRALDLVARYGGEEILLCMPDTVLEDGVVVCERARAAIEAYDWESIARGLKVTASFGVAQSTENGVAALLAACDEKLYQAKRSGRNKVCA